MSRSGAPELIGCMVAFKDRQHALKNPYAHLHQNDLTFEEVYGEINERTKNKPFSKLNMPLLLSKRPIIQV